MVFSYLRALARPDDNQAHHLHSEDNPSTQYQSRQPWNGAGPERQNALVSENMSHASEAILVIFFGLN